MSKKYIKPPHRFIEKMKLHPKQQEVWDAFFSGEYRAFVVNAGRRFGKSTLCMAIAVELAVNYGKRVWWVGKTNSDASRQWRIALQMLNGIYTKKSEVQHRMNFDYEQGKISLHGELSFRSAEIPDNLRGDGLDLLILDEAAFQTHEVYKVLRPALSDHRGDIIFISTPNGHNWFYEFYQRGLEENHNQYPRWWSKHYTSYDNTLIDPKEIDASKADLTETEFRVEHLAEFIDDIGKVFSGVHECATGWMQDIPREVGSFSMGIDLARKHDASVITVLDLRTNQQIFGIRILNNDWDLQKIKIASLIRAFRPAFICADATAVGQPVIEDIQKLVPQWQIEPFIITSASKPPLIQKLAVKLQNKEIQILNDQTEFGRIQLNELLAYEVQKSKSGMSMTYNAPRGGRDDTVIALALAVLAVTRKKSTINLSQNVFFPEQKKLTQRVNPKMNEYAKRSRELQKKLLEELGEL